MSAVIPWWFNMVAKLALARLPIPYSLWRQFGVFVHGRMDRLDYAMAVFKSHYAAGTLESEFTCLELGPGDSLLSALVAYACGAKQIYLLDVGRFASMDLALYQRAAAQLKACGLRVPQTFDSVDEMLRKCGAQYLSNGLAGLESIASDSVDFIWSHSVLEHVRKSEFTDTAIQCRRILRATGFASHHVDLKDHLARALNNLRFSEKVWESRLFRNSGFYTNRIRYSEMLADFDRCGFSVSVSAKECWSRAPTPRQHLHKNFRSLPDTDLLVSSFRVVLTTGQVAKPSRLRQPR